MLGAAPFFADYSVENSEHFILGIPNYTDENGAKLKFKLVEPLSVVQEKPASLFSRHFPATEGRRALGLSFTTTNSTIEHFVICFTSTDIHFSKNRRYNQCVCITEFYRQRNFSSNSKLMKRILECLVIASVATNSYLTFHMPPRLFNSTILQKYTTDISGRVKGGHTQEDSSRKLYMVRPTRTFLGMMLDHEYLHEIRSALQMKTTDVDDIIDVADKLLLMGFCQAARHTITVDSAEIKQIAYLHSLINVFVEDPRDLYTKSRFWRDTIKNLESCEDVKVASHHFKDIAVKIHKFVKDKMRFTPKSTPPVSFPGSKWNTGDNTMLADINSYIEHIKDAINLDDTISNYPNETVASFYEEDIPNETRDSSPDTSDSNEEDDDVDKEMFSQETEMIEGGEHPKTTIYDKFMKSQHRHLDGENFERCDCRLPDLDDIDTLNPRHML
jgi:hypothetical protein